MKSYSRTYLTLISILTVLCFSISLLTQTTASGSESSGSQPSEPFTITERTVFGLGSNTVYVTITDNIDKDSTINISNIFKRHSLTERITYDEVLLLQTHDVGIYGSANISQGKYKTLINNTINSTHYEELYYDNSSILMECDYVLADKTCLKEEWTVVGTKQKDDYLPIPQLKEKIFVNNKKIEQKQEGITLPKSSTIHIKFEVSHPFFGFGFSVPDDINKYNISVCSTDGQYCSLLDPVWYGGSTYTYKMPWIGGCTACSGSVSGIVLVNDTNWYNGTVPQNTWTNITLTTSITTLGYLYFNNQSNYTLVNSTEDGELPLFVEYGNGTDGTNPFTGGGIFIAYLFNNVTGNPVDRSGNGYDGVFGNGGTFNNSGIGKPDGAANLLDDNDQITIPASADSDMLEYTISVWFNPTHTMNSSEGIDVNEDRLWRAPTATAHDGLFDSATGTFRVSDVCAPVNNFLIGTTNEWIKGEWYHIAFVYDNVTTHTGKIYVNGVEEASCSIGYAMTKINPKSMIIGYRGASWGGAAGVYDNVIIWNKALSADEVMLKYNNTIGTHNATHLGEAQTEEDSPPQITIHSPDNKTYNTTAIDLNWSADTAIDWAAYSLNGDSNVSLSNCRSGHIDNDDGTCTVKLQTADTENMADLGAADSGCGGNRLFQIKWNISIPTLYKRAIKQAALCVYWCDSSGSPDTDVNISRILNQTWDEDISEDEWNEMQFDTSSITNFDSVTEGSWGCANVTDIVSADYNAENTYSSIRLLDPDYVPCEINEVGESGLPFGRVGGPIEWLFAEDKENFNGTGNLPYLNITYYKIFNTTITAEGGQNKIAVCANDTSGNLNCTTVHFSVMQNITFNVTDSYTGVGINSVEISCNYTGFDQGGDNTNPYGPYEFLPSDWYCTFSDPNDKYFNKTKIFAADNDKTVNVALSESGKLTYEEHDWLEAIYKCLYEGNCLALNLLLDINESTGKTWDQFKRTDQSIVVNETIISSVVNSTSNLSINYTVNVPTKEGYGLIDGIQGYDDFLPIRLSFWFLDETNTSCHSQGNYSVALVEPYCQPLIAYSVGQIETQMNFTVEMRPRLPAGNYTIVRSIEIDPNNVWIDYGQEIIGSILILQDSKDAGAVIKKTKTSISSDEMDGSETMETVKSEIQEQQRDQTEDKETDGLTGLSAGNALEPSYISVMVSLITLAIVVFMYKDSRRMRSPWGY